MRAFAPVADALWLDFVNTNAIQKNKVEDLFDSFSDLVQFLIECKAFSPSELSEIDQTWKPLQQHAMLDSAKRFRAHLRELAGNLAQSQQPAVHDLAAINEWLAYQAGYKAVVRSGAKYELKTHSELERPEQLLVPIAESIASTLCEGDPGQVKKCSNPECGLYFYDVTRNHRRRWCSMQTCGNRNKVNAYNRRRRPTVS